ncbi:hypothetical protein O0I10_009976 [Lichtheimia ornata]|uniref:Xylanolytic transcriptional activator regulatory domain-containing protein n=1 Tax=Lichtheimia ornata TaxID=688661 RepID=A0AAD7UWU1_9FUNG|nr:uncharacterized protein O0I10_009976 [Lichtheimia ornata]KAJ8654406.1 hypothetical protein O0I10_009976 [Lichtheimia ornata]
MGISLQQCKARGRPCTFYKDGSFDPDQEAGEDVGATQLSQEGNSSATAGAGAAGATDQQHGNNEDPQESCFLFADTKDSNYIRNKRRGPPLESRTSNTLASLGEGLRKVSLYETHTGKAFADAEPFGSFIKWIAEPPLPGRYAGSIEMPSRKVQMEMLEYHFSENYETMPIIPKRYFFDQLKCKGPFITPLLLNAIYAQTSRYITSDDELPKSEVFFHRAKRLLDDFMDVPRVSTVVALCYMSLYESRPSSTQRSGSPYCRSWMYSGMAYRMCLELGLHNQNNVARDLSPIEIELRKRVYWSCYCLDKLHSTGWERPWMLSTTMTQTDLPGPLPEDDEEEQLIVQGLVEKIKYARKGEEAMTIVATHRPMAAAAAAAATFHRGGASSEASNSNKHPEKEKVEYFQNHYWDILRGLPPGLQWTPISATSPEQVLQLPAPRPLVAHLHLQVLHGLLDSYFRSPDNSYNQLQRRILATCITQLVHCMCDRPASVIKFDVLIHMLLSATKVHVRHLYNSDMDIARHAWAMFDRSILAIHRLRKYATIPNSAKFLQHLGSSVEGYEVPHEILSSAMSSEHPPPPLPPVLAAPDDGSCTAAAAAAAVAAVAMSHPPPPPPPLTMSGLMSSSDDLHTLGSMYMHKPPSSIPTKAISQPPPTSTTTTAASSSTNLMEPYSGGDDSGYVVLSMNQQDWNPAAPTIISRSPPSPSPAPRTTSTIHHHQPFMLDHQHQPHHQHQHHQHQQQHLATTTTSSDIISATNMSSHDSTATGMIHLRQPNDNPPPSTHSRHHQHHHQHQHQHHLYTSPSTSQPLTSQHHDLYHSQVLSQQQEQEPSVWDFEQ